ncbi:MAG: ASCH domain-containing protein [Caldilineaceae bacterium]
MTSEIRTFGQRVENANYILRPGGYAVITNDVGQIALARTGGKYYLPGGGQDAGESFEDAARRETQEEVGLQIEIGFKIGLADQLVLAADTKHYYCKRCHFFSAHLSQKTPSVGAMELEHELVWMRPAQAIAALRLGSERWAVGQERQVSFWRAFLQAGLPTLAALPPDVPDAWGFGDSPQMADELGRLVYDGIKTATCGALWEYEHDGDALPQVGDLSMILDGAELPFCIIETTDVQIKPYNEVDAEFARAEGEGERTLEWWRQAHWRFFSRTLPRIGRQPSETMPLVCEQFRVIFRAQIEHDTGHEDRNLTPLREHFQINSSGVLGA